MTTTVSEWLGENFRTYFSNATSTRDFRVQMRGSKSVVFFTLYLGLLITLAYITYSNSNSGSKSIIEAQQSLKQFYDLLLGALGFIVSVVPPVMAASSVIAEKQRHSFDLVFSAPVTAKYYLVGKLISSFRYTWMLLVLALPVTAACVVLGGASWADVLGSYFLLSVIGVLISSIALGATIVSTKASQAVVLAIGVSIGYNILCGVAAAAAVFIPHGLSGATGTGTNEMSAIALLSPFLVGHSAMTYTEWYGMHVPNLLIVTGLAALISRLMLVCAGAQIMPYSKKLAANVRIHCLLYAVGIAAYVAAVGVNSIRTSSTLPGSGIAVGSDWNKVGIVTASFIFALSLLSPISCVSLLGENRLRPNGSFQFRRAFDGTPAGHLPFFLLLTVCVFLGVAGSAMRWGGLHSPDSNYWSLMVYACCLWVFGWGLSRWTSSFSRTLQQAQGLSFAAVLCLVALPLPIITMMAEPGATTHPSPWDLYILRPLGLYEENVGALPLAYGLVLCLFGLFVAGVGNRRLARAAETMKEARSRAA